MKLNQMGIVWLPIIIWSLIGLLATGVATTAAVKSGIITINLSKATSPVPNYTPFPTSTSNLDLATPTPTLQPVVQQINKSSFKENTQPTSIPQRKLVTVVVSDAAISGTFYCYEDRANDIVATQNNLNLALKHLSFCGDNIRNEISTCFSKCSQTSQSCINNCYGSVDMTSCTNNCIAQGNTCTDACPKTNGTECNSGDIDNLRNQLIQIVKDYCP